MRRKTLGAEALAHIFNYTSVESVKKAIQRGNFPVRVWRRRNGEPRASVAQVVAYFDNIKSEGFSPRDLNRLRRQPGWPPKQVVLTGRVRDYDL